MIKALIKQYRLKPKLLIDISGVKKGEPISSEAQTAMEKQRKFIAALQDKSVESLEIEVLRWDPSKYPLRKDKRFHRPVLIEFPLSNFWFVMTLIERKLEDLSIEKYRIIEEV